MVSRRVLNSQNTSFLFATFFQNTHQSGLEGLGNATQTFSKVISQTPDLGLKSL